MTKPKKKVKKPSKRTSQIRKAVGYAQTGKKKPKRKS
jgi:hypothetical protein